MCYNFCMTLFHLHKRRRLDSNNSLSVRLLDKVVYLAGIVAITMMIPQLRLIYGTQNASGFEPITWIMLAILDIPWIVYGFVHKDRPIVFIYTLWLIVNTLIFVGAVLY